MAENRLLKLRFQLTELILLIVALVLLIVGLVAQGWLRWTLLGAAGLLFLGCAVLLAGWWQRSFLVRGFARTSEAMVEVIKRPITLAVLDEIEDVLSRGEYTRGLASGFAENRAELEVMLLEKLKDDPRLKRFGIIPFSDQVMDLVAETTVNVVMETLSDHRTEELVSDLVRATIIQVRAAVEEREITQGPGAPVEKVLEESPRRPRHAAPE